MLTIPAPTETPLPVAATNYNPAATALVAIAWIIFFMALYGVLSGRVRKPAFAFVTVLCLVICIGGFKLGG